MRLSHSSKLAHPVISDSWKEKIYRALVVRSWWIFLFLGVVYVFYSHSLQTKNQDYTELKHRFLELERDKEVALRQREDLLLQINSQSDPAWIQLMLMKGLGVVPEGHLKVYFKKEDE